ncbi:hypothetical protein RJT34_30256 [Clitoria ternatea]|uniref:Uncharacterized protein n=1 Tax=Clitoria ternatea TaxID=43366 RepID=A0AAN9EU89_CLITE
MKTLLNLAKLATALAVTVVADIAMGSIALTTLLFGESIEIVGAVRLIVGVIGLVLLEVRIITDELVQDHARISGSSTAFDIVFQ